MRIKKIAVYNNKGGVGKTTIAVHLAYYAEELGIRTIATCIDAQADMWRWLTRGDGVLKGECHYERGCLDVVYVRDEVPEFNDDAAELLIIDCPPSIDLSLQLRPTLAVMPVHGRMAFENTATVFADLKDVCDVLVVINNSGRGGKRTMRELRRSLGCIPELKVAETELIESDTITRAGEYYLPVWGIPYASRSKAPAIMRALCREIFKAAGISVTKRGPFTKKENK